MQWQLTQLITGTAVIVHISQCSLQDWINERRLKKTLIKKGKSL